MYLAYSLLFTLGIFLSAPYYLWRQRKKGGFTHWRERLGFVPFEQKAKGAIWVHAVSVGETLAISGLVQELQQVFPERNIYLSHVTPTGRQAGENRLSTVAGRFYLPLDWRWTARQVLRRMQPSLLVIVETELWPNLLRAAHEAEIKTILVNARLSDRSFRGYRLVRFFMRHVLANVDLICTQTSRDAERFCQLGAANKTVVETGNLKFDAQPPRLGDLARALGEALSEAGRRPVLVAASTMAGEEPLVLEAWDKVRARYPGALLILAPRHPARFEEVARVLKTAGRHFVRRTMLNTQELVSGDKLAEVEILLLDTIGELAGVFELADVVFMGGSLVPTGGHNVLEPAYWSKAIVFGPHMENFRDIAQLFLQAEAAVQVGDAAELGTETLKLLDDSTLRLRLGANARQVLEQQRGATERTLKHIRELLEAEVPA